MICMLCWSKGRDEEGRKEGQKVGGGRKEGMIVYKVEGNKGGTTRSMKHLLYTLVNRYPDVLLLLLLLRMPYSKLCFFALLACASRLVPSICSLNEYSMLALSLLLVP